MNVNRELFNKGKFNISLNKKEANILYETVDQVLFNMANGHWIEDEKFFKVLSKLHEQLDKNGAEFTDD